MIRIAAAAIGGFVLGAGGGGFAFGTVQMQSLILSYYSAPPGSSARIVCVNSSGTPVPNVIPTIQRAYTPLGANVFSGQVTCP